MSETLDTTPVEVPAPLPESKVTQGPVSEVKKAKAARKVQRPKDGEVASIGEPRLIFVSYKDLILPKGEEDPRWDERMNLPLEKDFLASLKAEGILYPLDVTETAKGFVINAGRTRARAAIELKLESVPLLVTNIDEDAAMLRAVDENEQRRDSPPTVKAKAMQRLLWKGVEESEVAKRFKMTGPVMHGYLALLELPAKVQKLVDEGMLTRTAALNLTHLDAAKVEAAADKAVAAAALGVKTRSKDTAKEAGKGMPDRLNGVRIKAMLSDLKSSDFKGKHAKAAVQGAILFGELVLDARKWDAFMGKLDDICKGG